MAAGGERRVKLNIRAGVTGTEQVRELGREVQGLGDAAQGSSEDFEALSRRIEEAKRATVAARAAEAAAKAEVNAQRRYLQELGDAHRRAKAAADDDTRASQEFKAAMRAQRSAIVEASIALRQRREALTAASREAKAAVKAERDLAAAASQAARAQASAASTIGQSLGSLRTQYQAVRNLATAALGGTLVGALAGDLAETADGFANLQARIKLVTGEGQALGDALQGVQDIAQRTGGSLESIGELFARVAQAGQAFGLAQADALALTESIGQAVQISGASAQASEAAITQLIQGLQSGVLRGEEFNSVMEQAPRLARALADGLGVTTGELRALAQQGALTSDVVVRALQGQAQALQAEFETLPPTVERAIGRLGAAWQVYVGEAGEASGASATAASAIDALARNLDTLGNVLFGLGKAALAFQAVRLAAGYFSAAAAATATATAATVAHTAAVAANTAAQSANAAATATSVAAVGRLSRALGAVKGFTLVALLTNLQELGTWIGETVAKMTGAGKVLEDNERALRADEEATRANAAAKAALAQQTQLAADEALGLTKRAKALVAEFEGVASKGGTVADSLEKVARALQLGDISGIQTAGAALDALALRGKASASELRSALAAALKGVDLGTFEVNARAAFDASEQGARRLRTALDALADESLRRAGTSAEEMGSGFSKAATVALNDVDALVRTLRQLGAEGEDAGRVLAGSLDKAIAAANTERAVQAVIDRIEALGEAGALTGERLANGLEAARKKLDDLRPGVNSLEEALRVLGLRSREESRAMAERLGEAYRRIAGDAAVSLADQIEAFGKWRTAVEAASGGVESGQVKLQAKILEGRAAVAGLGEAFASAMGRAGAAVDTTRGKVQALAADAKSAASGIASIGGSARGNAAELGSTPMLSGRTADSDFSIGTKSGTIGSVLTVPQPDNSGNWRWEVNPLYSAGGHWVSTRPETQGGPVGFSSARGNGSPVAPAPAVTPSSVASTRHEVVLKIGGASGVINVQSTADAERLRSMLAALSLELERASG